MSALFPRKTFSVSRPGNVRNYQGVSCHKQTCCPKKNDTKARGISPLTQTQYDGYDNCGNESQVGLLFLASIDCFCRISFAEFAVKGEGPVDLALHTVQFAVPKKGGQRRCYCVVLQLHIWQGHSDITLS